VLRWEVENDRWGWTLSEAGASGEYEVPLGSQKDCCGPVFGAVQLVALEEE
jgi:hypothetical protein